MTTIHRIVRDFIKNLILRNGADWVYNNPDKTTKVLSMYLDKCGVECKISKTFNNTVETEKCFIKLPTRDFKDISFLRK